MRTPLYRVHKSLGARFMTFSGWEMPLQYTGIVDEVKAVRNSAGVFDVSHMGRLLVEGKKALETLQHLTTNNLEKLEPGKVQYNLLTNEKGGVKDDVTIYMLSEDSFLLCVNASNREKVKEWLSSRVRVKDLSGETVQVAVQGREAQRLLRRFYDLSGLRFYRFRTFGNTIVSRTGYTGEDGFEVYAPVEEGVELFRELVRESKPCGLGARDVLRIEAGLPLYGNELSEDITPLEANLDRFVDLSKDFLGKEAMLSKGVEKKLFGLELLSRGVPRKSYRLFREGREIGTVSSGTFSPTLGRGIALCFVKVEERREGSEVIVKANGRDMSGVLKTYPFVRRKR